VTLHLPGARLAILAGSIAVGLLVWHAPALGDVERRLPPQVDLSSIRRVDQHAVASVAGGGEAELTLDVTLQDKAERLLAAARPAAGAIVALDLRTGKILVWTGVPGGAAHGALYRPAAPAASVFKIVTTAALLERTRITPDTRVCIRGGVHAIEREHLDPPRDGSASCSPFFAALGHSRNAVFAQLATHSMARDDLVEIARRFGFNQALPFDVSIPMGELEVPYNDLSFARTATGFQGSKLSPLGAAELAAIVAGSGFVREKHIVERAGTWQAPARARVIRRAIRERTAHWLRRMMEVTTASGTSFSAFHDEHGRSYLGGVRVAGKTGTLKPDEDAGTASWFIGFAPSRDPRIVVSVLLQNGDVWRRKANEVARDVLRAYFAARRTKGVTDPTEDP
jgi:cell division protein FtsI/penicillin-binding protein 2